MNPVVHHKQKTSEQPNNTQMLSDSLYASLGKREVDNTYQGLSTTKDPMTCFNPIYPEINFGVRYLKYGIFC